VIPFLAESPMPRATQLFTSEEPILNWTFVSALNERRAIAVPWVLDQGPIEWLVTSRRNPRSRRVRAPVRGKIFRCTTLRAPPVA